MGLGEKWTERCVSNSVHLSRQQKRHLSRSAALLYPPFCREQRKASQQAVQLPLGCGWAEQLAQRSPKGQPSLPAALWRLPSAAD